MRLSEIPSKKAKLTKTLPRSARARSPSHKDTDACLRHYVAPHEPRRAAPNGEVDGDMHAPYTNKRGEEREKTRNATPAREKREAEETQEKTREKGQEDKGRTGGAKVKHINAKKETIASKMMARKETRRGIKARRKRTKCENSLQRREDRKYDVLISPRIGAARLRATHRHLATPQFIRSWPNRTLYLGASEARSREGGFDAEWYSNPAADIYKSSDREHRRIITHADVSQDTERVKAHDAQKLCNKEGNKSERADDAPPRRSHSYASTAPAIGQVECLSDNVRVDVGGREENNKGREPVNSFGDVVVQHGRKETRRDETKQGGSKPKSKQRKRKLSTKRRDERDSTMNACIASHNHRTRARTLLGANGIPVDGTYLQFPTSSVSHPSWQSLSSPINKRTRAPEPNFQRLQTIVPNHRSHALLWGDINSATELQIGAAMALPVSMRIASVREVHTVVEQQHR
ncbi:hypothetical protein C8R45DRAFT_939643 [Mycena sanguinolenta]|nr:hypothetical protein C8R45DRAFT_939643 [Mycena sanguinolenta]